MFERESLLNTVLLQQFQLVANDIPSDRIYEPGPGNGHPPVWVLGHLALCAEFGQNHCGGSLTHPEWMSAFGPGSSDQMEDTGQFHRDELVAGIIDGYPRFAELAQQTDEESMSRPHGVPQLDNTPLNTVGELVSHLLTSHFAFHMAQLSGWRRAAGHPPLI